MRKLWFIAAMLATAALFSGSGGHLPLALVPLALLGAVVLLPKLAAAPPPIAVAALIFLAFLLDDPHALPFNSYEAITEQLGVILFNNPEEFLPLPPLKLRGLELATLALMALALYRDLCAARQRGGTIAILRDGRKLPWLVATGGLLAATALGVANGLARHGSLELLITQVRPAWLFVAWAYIGFALLRRAADAELVIAALTASMLLKAAQGWYVYLVPYGGSIAGREYLLDHYTSLYLATAGFWLVMRWRDRRQGWHHDLALAAALAFIAGPYIINDRRASLVGVGMALATLAFLRRRELGWRHARLALAAAAAGAVFLAATWQATGPLAVPARTLASLMSTTDASDHYRKLENYNLYREVMDAPWLGMGYGRPFRELVAMPEMKGYRYQLSIPHNAQLGFWAYTGAFGAAAYSVFLVVGVALCTRIATNQRTRRLGELGVAYLVMYGVFVFADIGLTQIRGQLLAGLLIGMAARLDGRET